ncbi:hypothetical protein HCG49_17110 [Arenibacter sp. 6A1]|uniref:hypothetical protein n=1 Tax=Arenibacter sp. 6A1 TaxID=2720391 RepID=UPI001444FEFC|nr:hypothetical protein [Arenibacter sp. 6A1]NKI28276.1 hypothetical protein [Arenibacter sp. 6A1]
MIKFFGENFELDMSHLRITLVEENNIFHKSFLRNYSLPFSFKLDDETSKKLGFIGDYNSRNRKVKHLGNFQYGNNFAEGNLLLSYVSRGVVQGTVNYGKSAIQLLEIPLRELPFEPVDVPSILGHAKSQLEKHWPEARYNFPMIIDDAIVLKSNYDKFEGIINKIGENGNFITNSLVLEDGKNVPSNRNVMAPCMYLMEILKVGFDSANIVMTGNFVQDKVNEKILIYIDKYLENFTPEKVNMPPSSFELTDFIPEMTFGAFLNKIKNWLNLDIRFRKNIVTINYQESNFKNIAFPNMSHLENDGVRINMNNKKIYTLKYDKNDKISIDAKSNLVAGANYTVNDVETIDMGLSVLKEATHDTFTTAKVTEDQESFKLLLYNGLQGGYNISPQSVFGRSFTVDAVFNRFWKKWVAFRLNTSLFTDRYKTDNDQLNIDSGMFKYDNKHIIKKITRSFSGDEEDLEITVESEVIF